MRSDAEKIQLAQNLSGIPQPDDGDVQVYRELSDMFLVMLRSQGGHAAESKAPQVVLHGDQVLSLPRGW
ncbi:hypothetical protein FXN61_13845 [Lentzea sp. PSKA42]|uniref:Uncharacterized protein n=1 Tax=Lentzea indica TaxID=2604800 RepID=A0ABX1FGT5_9PSEU|nr:hypothetical protein [Lentzea indica]NKE57856.1 hypothetical protein [Lentzea indica]